MCVCVRAPISCVFPIVHGAESNIIILFLVVYRARRVNMFTTQFQAQFHFGRNEAKSKQNQNEHKIVAEALAHSTGSALIQRGWMGGRVQETDAFQAIQMTSMCAHCRFNG